MKTITLSATFDGERIRLEDDYPLPKDARLLVTLVEPVPDNDEEFRRDWYQLAAHSLSRAYGENEPEYTLDMIKELNPLYEGR
jgi:hypothetical protein